MRSFTYGSIICLIVPLAKASRNTCVWLLGHLMKFCICFILFILWLGHMHSSNLNLSQESCSDSVSCCSKLTISALLSINWLVVRNLSKNLSSSSFHVWMVPFRRHSNHSFSLLMSEKPNICNITWSSVTSSCLHTESGSICTNPLETYHSSVHLQQCPIVRGVGVDMLSSSSESKESIGGSTFGWFPSSKLTSLDDFL